MSNNLYGNSDKKLNELEKSQERLNKLSIEYNPLMQIKKDLGVVTKKDEIDEENARTLLEIKHLNQEYGEKRRIVEAGIIYDYCLGHDYCLLPITEYRSDLPEKSLKAIEEFITENKISLAHNRDNFFILAPRKYFYKNNMDTSNVAFNIYYMDEYIRQPKPRQKMVEVYGSNFNRSLFSPLIEMFTLRSSNERLNFIGKLIVSGIAIAIAGVVSLSAILAQDFNINSEFVIFIGSFLALMFYWIGREYNKVFKDRVYIYRLQDPSRAMRNREYIIEL